MKMFFETKVFFSRKRSYRFSIFKSSKRIVLKKKKNPPKFENLFYGPTSRATVKT